MSQNLLNGCSCSDVWIHPKNWKTLSAKKALEANWFVECKFYDPAYSKKYPNGFPFRTRLNRFKTLAERKAAAAALLIEIPKLLEDRGYNPITKKFMFNPDTFGKITRHSSIIPALRIIHAQLSVAKSTHRDLRQVINNVEKSINALNLYQLKIAEFRRGHLKMILDNLKLSNGQYNKYLSYLSILLREIVEMDALDHNPVADIRNKKVVKKIREVLKISELVQITAYLKTEHYEFYRYTMIFFHSGARSSELCRLQIKDVNVANQEYRVTIQKGSYHKEVIKIILPDAVPFWVDLLRTANNPEDFVFSKGLEPGPDHIEEYQITKRWKRLVKDRLCFIGGQLRAIPSEPSDIAFERINADFYAMKHLFLDLLDKAEGESSSSTPFLSKSLADHTTDITEKVYLVGREKRKNEILKKTKVHIFPVSV